MYYIINGNSKINLEINNFYVYIFKKYDYLYKYFDNDIIKFISTSNNHIIIKIGKVYIYIIYFILLIILLL